MIDPQTIAPRSLPSLPLESRQMLPTASGIYFAIDGNGVVQYIGRSQNINQRWLCHHRAQQLSNLEAVRIAWLEISDLALLPEIEEALIDWLQQLAEQMGKHETSISQLKKDEMPRVDSINSDRATFLMEAAIAYLSLLRARSP